MALPTNKILLRSPYWITKSDPSLQYVLISLRIWNGAMADEPTEPTVRLRSTALNGVASIDIAELARDYVEVTFIEGEESAAVLVSASVTSVNTDGEGTTDVTDYYLGLDGYGTFTDGSNYVMSKRILISTDKLSCYDGQSIRVPVLAETFTGYRLQSRSYVGYSDYHTVTGLTPATNTADVFDYVTTSEASTYADRVVFEFSDVPDIAIDIEYQECNKYGLTRCYFVNRFGAIQQYHFTGRYNLAISSKDTKYTRNILDNGGYDSTRHQQYILSKNGKVDIELNTGWVPEEENDTFLELLMSEQIWLRIESSKFGVGFVPRQSSIYTIPVLLTSKNLGIKSKLNDKLINYSFKFEGANDWINSVR